MVFLDWHICTLAQGCQLDELSAKLYVHQEDTSALAFEYGPLGTHVGGAREILYHVCVKPGCDLPKDHPCHRVRAKRVHLSVLYRGLLCISCAS
jgi:hypothetical protein